MKKVIERPGRGAAKATSVAKAPVGIDEATLVRDLRTFVQSARQRIAMVAYSTLTLLCRPCKFAAARMNTHFPA